MSEDYATKIATLENDVKWIIISIEEQNKLIKEMNNSLQRGRGALLGGREALLVAGVIGAFLQKIIAAIMGGIR